MKNNTKEVNKLCANCGDTFIQSRTDKKFCTDACRIDYNNTVKLEKRISLPTFAKTIPKIILHNYKILRQVNPEGIKTTVSRTKLESMGFNPRYITSFYKTQKGNIYSFCFDQGFLVINDDKVLLVVQNNQVEQLQPIVEPKF